MEAYVQAWVPHERGMRGQRSGVGWVGGWVGGGKGTTSERPGPPCPLTSSYSLLAIHICWKVESEERMEPPIQTLQGGREAR